MSADHAADTNRALVTDPAICAWVWQLLDVLDELAAIRLELERLEFVFGSHPAEIREARARYQRADEHASGLFATFATCLFQATTLH